jgi:hypothetical protein
MQREMLRSCVSNWDIHIDETAIQVNGQMLGKSFSTIWSAGNAWLIDSMSFAVARKPEPGELEPQTEILVSMGRRKSAPDYLLAVQVLQVYSRRVAALYEKFDILLTPTLGLPPLPLGSFDPTDEDPISGLRKAAEFCPLYTSIQCYRPAGNVGSALLEHRRLADWIALCRAIRRRSNVVPARATARRGEPRSDRRPPISC